MKAGIRCLLSCCIGAVVAAPVYGQNTVTVNAVGPGIAMAGETETFEFFITTAGDSDFRMRGYVIVPPYALALQDGATGSVGGAAVSLNSGRSDWVMCGVGCNCVLCYRPGL